MQAKRGIQRGRPAGATTFEAAPAKAFGAAVRAIRTEEGIAQETLAHLAGIVHRQPVAGRARFREGERGAAIGTIPQRRHGADDTANLTLGGLILDPAHHEAALNGQPLKLTPTEYALLAQLVRHAGKVVTLKHLLRAVWGPQAEEQTHYLRVYANHLRKKLEGSLLEIKNEPGIGYRLVEK